MLKHHIRWQWVILFFLCVSIVCVLSGCESDMERDTAADEDGGGSEAYLARIGNETVTLLDVEAQMNLQPAFLRTGGQESATYRMERRKKVLFSLVDMTLLSQQTTLTQAQRRVTTLMALSQWYRDHEAELADSVVLANEIRVPSEAEITAEIERHPEQYRHPSQYRFVAVQSFNPKRIRRLRLAYRIVLTAAPRERVREHFAKNLVEFSLQKIGVIGPISRRDPSEWTCAKGIEILKRTPVNAVSDIISCHENRFGFVDMVERIAAADMPTAKARSLARLRLINEQKERLSATIPAQAP